MLHISSRYMGSYCSTQTEANSFFARTALKLIMCFIYINMIFLFSFIRLSHTFRQVVFYDKDEHNLFYAELN